MTDKHEADPRFLDRLEWHLTGELRRLNRTGKPDKNGIRILKIAALVLVSVGLGAGAMEASQQLQESWRTELLEVRSEVQLEIARHRLILQREVLEETRAEVERGLRNSDDLIEEEKQIAQAQSMADLIALRLEEIRQSGREPLGEVSSPLVGGRDFVSERIEIQIRIAQANFNTLHRHAEQSRSDHEAGVSDNIDLQGWNLAVREAELDLAGLSERLGVREAFLNGEITAVKAELLVLELDIRNRILLLNQQLELYGSEIERFREMEAAGLTTPSFARQMQVQIASMEGQLHLAEAELDIVQRELEKRTASN